MKDKQKATLNSESERFTQFAQLSWLTRGRSSRQWKAQLCCQLAPLSVKTPDWSFFFPSGTQGLRPPNVSEAPEPPRCLTPPQIEQCYSYHVSHGRVKHSTWPVRFGGGVFRECHVSHLNLLLLPANINYLAEGMTQRFVSPHL